MRLDPPEWITAQLVTAVHASWPIGLDHAAPIQAPELEALRFPRSPAQCAPLLAPRGRAAPADSLAVGWTPDCQCESIAPAIPTGCLPAEDRSRTLGRNSPASL